MTDDARTLAWGMLLDLGADQTGRNEDIIATAIDAAVRGKVDRADWELAIRERDQARAALIGVSGADLWRWMDDEANYLESMGDGMGVRINAGALRGLIDAAVQAERDAVILHVTKLSVGATMSVGLPLEVANELGRLIGDFERGEHLDTPAPPAADAEGFTWTKNKWEPTVWHLTRDTDESDLCLAVAHECGSGSIWDALTGRFIEVSQPGDADLRTAKSRAWAAMVDRRWHGLTPAPPATTGDDDGR